MLRVLTAVTLLALMPITAALPMTNEHILIKHSLVPADVPANELALDELSLSNIAQSPELALPQLVSDVGLAASCCDISPPYVVPTELMPNMGYAAKAFGFCDARLGADRHPECNVNISYGGGHRGGGFDWATVYLPVRGTVYVPAVEFGQFVRRFETLPRHFRLTVVSGLEDIGLPREVFRSDVYRRGSHAMPANLSAAALYPLRAPNRTDSPVHPYRFALNCSAALYAHAADPLTAFLSDERLLHLFVQNDDLLGCSTFSHGRQGHPLWKECVERSPFTHKVTPIPIGVSLWERHAEQSVGLPLQPIDLSAAEGGATGGAGGGGDVAQLHHGVDAKLREARGAAGAFSGRELALSAPFTCEGPEEKLYEALEGLPNLKNAAGTAAAEDTSERWDQLLSKLARRGEMLKRHDEAKEERRRRAHNETTHAPDPFRQ